ncbi:MAG: hypothetical protein FWF72_06125, partial [Paludibacter sp.]|nr:hypothetical protein [Paludibacter sp.]
MKEKFDIAYITTFINTDYIYKLIDSIIINNKTIKTMLIVVNQTKQFLNLEKYSNSNNVIVELQTEKQSLSKARNVGIECLIEHEFDVRYVSFPDDDSSFDVNFFEKFNNIIIDNNNYLIDVYGE